MQRVCAAADAYHVPNSQIFGEVTFKSGDFGTAYIGRIAMNVDQRSIDLRTNLVVLRGKVYEFDGFSRSFHQHSIPDMTVAA
jgi:hypothetical protein